MVARLDEPGPWAERDMKRPSPYLRYFLAPTPARLGNGLFGRCVGKLGRVFRRCLRAVFIGIPFIAILTSYATFLCLTQRRRAQDTELLPLFRHFFTCEAYSCSPFFMYVNAYLHTLCAQFMRSRTPLEHPSLELGAGEGSFSEATLTGSTLSILSSVLPSDGAHLRKRAVGERVAIMDVEDLPLESGCMRFIFMINGLYHVGDQPRAMAEIARVLAPGGIVAFNYPVEDIFLRCFPQQRLLSWLGWDGLRRGDLERLRRQHFVDEVLSARALLQVLHENDLEAIQESPFASVRAMRLAYSLYWLVRHTEGSVLDRLTRLRLTKKMMDALLDDVFYPLLRRDGEDCRSLGGTYLWWVARKRVQTRMEVQPLRFVCPVCKAPFPDGSYVCAVCGRRFPVADGVPVLLGPRAHAGGN